MKSKQVNQFENPAVAEVFATYPPAIRGKLLKLRELIYKTAAKNKDIGPLEETLKWGEPSYLTSQSRTGTTIRIHHRPKDEDHYGLFVSCNTNLVASYKKKYGKQLQFEGKRAIIFHKKDRPDQKILADCIEQALTYHQRKKN